MQTASDSPGLPGLILLAHGSRDAQWRQPIEAVAQALQQTAPQLPCRCAYLEACAPDLDTAVDQLVREGATRIAVLPLFLGTGKHAREDIPRLVDALRNRYPALDIALDAPAGENPRVTALLAQLALESANR
jgi:sirohydrochlorin cobaltochelatase